MSRPALVALALLIVAPLASAETAPAKAPAKAHRTISASVDVTDEGEEALLAAFLSDANAGLCAQAQLPPACTTEQLQERAGRKDVRIFATIDEWAAAVLAQAKETAVKTQAQRLRTLAESKDVAALQAAAKKALGQ